MSNQINPPKKSAGDLAYGIIKAGVGAVPFGGTVAEVIGMVFGPPLQKRTEQWQQEVSDAINELNERFNIPLEELQQNEVFIDTVLHATQIALRTSDSEKLHALRNAILNTALVESPDDILHHIFLNYVEDFTGWHIRLLHFANNPIEWLGNRGIESSRYRDLLGGNELLLAMFPEFGDYMNPSESRVQELSLIWKDLADRGLTTGSQDLVNQGFPDRMIDPPGYRWLSPIGEKLLTFILEPKQATTPIP